LPQVGVKKTSVDATCPATQQMCTTEHLNGILWSRIGVERLMKETQKRDIIRKFCILNILHRENILSYESGCSKSTITGL